MPGPYRIGIDLGGTKIAGILLGPDGEIVSRARMDAPRGIYRKTLEAIRRIVADLDPQSSGNAPLGIGIPGSIAPATGRVQNANSTWLNGTALDEDLKTLLGRRVRVANDANCFALSEAVDGAAKGAKCTFGVILGTGCGGGLVYDGRLIDGPRGTGGEWGHNPLPWPLADELPGPGCWCGKQGCIETWVSGPGLCADHGRVTGETLDAEEISTRASNHDAAANQTLTRHASRLARALAAVVNIFDPDCVVLGGGVSNMAHLYEQLPGLMAPYLFAHDTNVRVLPPLHGAESGVRGAAWLWAADETEAADDE